MESDYIPLSPGDLVEISRESFIFRIGDRGWIESMGWATGVLICVVQLFEKSNKVRILSDDLIKISNT